MIVLFNMEKIFTFEGSMAPRETDTAGAGEEKALGH
jgi:hypothetical protein